MAVTSAASPPAPLGSLALNTMTHAGLPLSSSSSTGSEGSMARLGFVIGPESSSRWHAVRWCGEGPRYNRCILFEGPLSCDRYENLDVSDLRVDLRRSSRSPRSWHRTRDPMVSSSDELDLPRMRSP